ncbi:autotransporter outer membrane beta-barrel domain-containing protein [Arabiibacter massiliensis]|uniref:hypothetical protein n=1 Tax=Arabiibacter massiliensis TaxID=1870985 RepID=UPI0009BBA061|nr:hypothetical protein [Arabiibacter massiliensis]
MNRQTIRNRALDLRHAALAGLLALLAALAVCAVPATSAHADDPVEIWTAEQLRAIPGNSSASYILMADIDLGINQEWTPIGAPSSFNDSAATGFQGTFDGNGHTISGVYITSFSENAKKDILYAGLFGCTNGATIKNLTLDGPFVTGTYSKGSGERDLMVGALVGLAVNTNISSCTVVNATVADKFNGERTDTKNYAIGGMVGDYYTSGKASKTLSNCSMAGTVNTAAKFPDFKVINGTPIQAFTGGIVGRVRERGVGTASVANCMFDGKVSGPGFVGPFVGGARSQADETEAADISLLAANRSIGCCYAGSITGVASQPNKTYNCGPGVWNGDVYAPAQYVVTDANRAAALEFLNQSAGDYPWRISSHEGRELLVLDYRKVAIDSLALEGGMAKLSAAMIGFDYGAELSWSVDGEVKGTGTTFETPIASQPQTVEAFVQDGDRRFSDSRDVEAAHAEFSLAKARDGAGDVQSLTVNLRSASDGFTANDFAYTWYGVKDGKDTDLGVQGATLGRDRFNGFESFKAVVASKASGEKFDELTATTSGRTVYLSLSAGDDGNDGYEPDKPVKTMQRAFEQLKDNAPREGNVIVVMDQYASTEFGYDDKTFNKAATITSYDADYGVDYRSAENGGAFLSFYNTSTDEHKGADSTRIKGKLLFADTTFKDITLSASNGGNAVWRIGYLYCQGYSLTMDTGVRMEGYRNTSEAIKSYGLLKGTKSQDFNIVGGYANYNEDPSKGYPQDRGTCEIVIKSGSYGRVIAGGRNYDCPENGNTGVNGISHNQFATEKEPFNVSVTVDIAAGQSMVTTGEATCDIGQLTGGQTDGTIYSNSAITLKSGVVPLVFGSSIGYNRSVNSNGTAYPNNDFVGRVQVNMEGGSVAQLYGGCLGRTADNAKEKVDARFLSSRFTPQELSDIEINVSGGSIGTIPGIGDDGTLIGVFAAGAGGVTGEGDPEAGTVENAVDIALNISGGTISGKLYGGGYGQSSAVTNASLACLEAGNLYGSSTVNITGGTISADVYGGGAGTTAYLADNPDANALAQIVGDVRLSISNAEIDGTVYGGSQGATQQGCDCTSMAKITGNVELSLGEGAHVAGDVFGGSALGTVTGNATTVLAGADGSPSVEGSVYGGGEGALVEDYALEQQLAVGAVEGSTALSLAGSTVAGNVFGGGSMGAVLGSASVEVRGSSVAGSAYAAGEGSYLGKENKDVALQKAIGWVKGDASLVLADGANVAGNVFGGGNLGVVGDGSLDSGTVPYVVDDPADVSVLVENAQVGGSIFGGGAGDVNTAGQMPRLLGAVFGTATVTVHEGTVGADVFGGGDQSYSYAPLDQDGVPERAATVIVNGGDALYVHTDDGRVAEGPGEGVREVDAAPGDASTQRAVNLGGSVFGGGNIADAHTVSANNYTMYGTAEVFIKGFGISFTNDERGGVYGDGNLSRVYGERTVTLVRLWEPLEDGKLGSKSFFSLQRANRAVVHDCSIYLMGAKDLVNESDSTLYSLNRVGALNVYAGSTVQFDTVVNGLGSLYSDVLPERTFTNWWNELEVTEYGDNLTNDEKNDCRKFTRGELKSWYDALGGEHHWTNTLVVNTGKWLDVKDPSDTVDARYGTVTGLFSLVSSTASDGGSFVYGQSTPEDSTGAFVSLNESGDPYRPPYLEIYTKRTADVDGKECRIWFIKGSSYVYQRELRAYTTGDTVSIRTQLPVARPGDGKMNIWVGREGIYIDERLADMRKSEGAQGKYAVGMTIGSSEVLPFYDGPSGWEYNYSNDVRYEETALLPATITLDIAELAADDELATQSGLVVFSLEADDGTRYSFEIEIVLERAYAVANETAHYGRVYENIAVENMTPITPTSSYTTQFTTTYSPGAYRSRVAAELSANTSAAIHGEANEGGVFPKGTKITMVNITNPTSPTFYYYECDKALTTIPLTEFASMADEDMHYKNPTGNTVIVENLLFVVDYAQANGGDGRSVGTTHIALNHRYGSGQVKNDILRYPYVDDNGNQVERYNNLWNGYEVAGITDGAYLGSQLLNPDNGASSSPVKVGHTDNFMYDTYTTKLVLDKNTTCVSTLFDESEVMLQVSLYGKSNWAWLNYQNKTFPLGTKLVVKRPDGTAVSERYFNEKTTWGSDGYLMVNLGNRLEREYTVELQVARYVDGGKLDSVFSWLWPSHSGGEYRLDAQLYVSADGLYRSTGDRYAHHEAEFSAARSYDVDPPEYELESKFKDSLEYKDGQVQGMITLKGDKKNNINSDAEMRVLRRPAGSEYAAVDITTLGGTVTRESQGNSGHTKFTVTDHPASGTYEYEIRLGNTVYYQTVAVP